MLAIVVCAIVFVIGVALDRKDITNPDSPALLLALRPATSAAVSEIKPGNMYPDSRALNL